MKTVAATAVQAKVRRQREGEGVAVGCRSRCGGCVQAMVNMAGNSTAS